MLASTTTPLPPSLPALSQHASMMHFMFPPYMMHPSLNMALLTSMYASVSAGAAPAFAGITATPPPPLPVLPRVEVCLPKAVVAQKVKHAFAERKPQAAPTIEKAIAEGSQRRIGAYTVEERAERVRRFIEKRKRRVWGRKARYTIRKAFAESRRRYKGRFVTKEMAAALDAQEKARKEACT
eukprot:PLAT14560.1.p1 GENE.PLAT14560.1~~PLAT14560.1.p1  ORF type:complete len:182 (+),score=22.00 PLAT14560.1:37-582(+)